MVDICSSNDIKHKDSLFDLFFAIFMDAILIFFSCKNINNFEICFVILVSVLNVNTVLFSFFTSNKSILNESIEIIHGVLPK